MFYKKQNTLEIWNSIRDILKSKELSYRENRKLIDIIKNFFLYNPGDHSHFMESPLQQVLFRIHEFNPDLTYILKEKINPIKSIKIAHHTFITQILMLIFYLLILNLKERKATPMSTFQYHLSYITYNLLREYHKNQRIQIN